MRVVARPDIADEFIDEIFTRLNERPHEPQEWSAGITTLIHCLRKAWYRRHSTDNGGAAGAGMSQAGKLTVIRGTAYHALLPPTARNREVGRRKTVETVVDGVAVPGEVVCYDDWDEPGLTPDGAETFAVCELKTTVAGTKRAVNEGYVEQMAGNAWIAGVRFTRLFIFHMVGDMRPPDPIMRVFEYEFEDGELARWGRELTRRLGVLRSAEPPSLTEHYSWECRYCEYHEKVGGPCPGGGGRGFTWFGQGEITDLLGTETELTDGPKGLSEGREAK